MVTGSSVDSLIAAALISAIAVLIGAIVTQIGTFKLEESRIKAQTLLEEKRFLYQQCLADAVAAREQAKIDAERLRERNKIVLPVRSALAALAEVLRPVYVRGAVRFDIWEEYNQKLIRLSELEEAPVLLSDDYILLRDFVIQTTFTRRFCQENLSKHAHEEEAGILELHTLLMNWASSFVEGLAIALEVFGDSNLAAEVRRRQFDALDRERTIAEHRGRTFSQDVSEDP